MRQVMVRYSVRPERAEENARMITSVFERLAGDAPRGLRYASYRLDDGVTFMHIASIDDPTNNPLLALEEFQRFTSTISERCDTPPVTTVLHEVGSYSNS